MKSDKEKISLIDLSFALLRFFNLLDKGNKLSLTNLSLVIILAKIATSPFEYAGAAILLPILGSYMQKRYETNKAEKEAKALESQANADLAAKIDKVQADHEEVVKALAETKKLLSNTNLAAGFNHRK